MASAKGRTALTPGVGSNGLSENKDIDNSSSLPDENGGSGVSGDKNDQQAQHSAFIEEVLSKVLKIQKDSRGRRYRILQGKIGESVDALTEFKDEAWPPGERDLPEPPDWMGGDGDEEQLKTASNLSGEDETTSISEDEKGHTEKAQQDDGTQDEHDDKISDRATASTKELSESSNNLHMGGSVKDLQAVVKEEAFNGGDTMLAERSVTTDNHKVSEPRTVTLSNLDDDPQTREPMHPAVSHTIRVLCLVMNHPQTTAKLCELALDVACLFITNQYVSGRAGGRSSAQAGTDDGNQEEKRPDASASSLLHKLIEATAKCSESSSDVVQMTMSKTLIALMTSPKCGIHEAAMLMAVRATFHVYLVSKSAAAKEVSKSALLDMLKSVYGRMETYGIQSIQTSNHKDSVNIQPLEVTENHTGTEISKNQPEQQSNAFASQFHTDSYLLFRALCKLSAKTLPGDDGSSFSGGGSKLLSSFTSTVVDPLALNSKILSLELILSVLEHCGDEFRNGDKFIYAVQNYLCVSLLKNCMSNQTAVAYLSLKIFLVLVYKFKSHLKSEIEVFVANIFLRILESPNSSSEQKALVLEALRALCSDPLMLTQIFLNYDCDFDAVNLYKNIVHNLTRLSGKSRGAFSSSATRTDEMEMSVAGLEVLVLTLRAFLKGLGLRGGDDNFLEEAGAASKFLGSLQLDVGRAIKAAEDPALSEKRGSSASLVSDDTTPSGWEAESTGTPKEDIPSNHNGAGTDVAEKIVDAFDRKRNAQQNFETGIVKFKLSLKSGLLYFIKNGFVQLEAREIALFFHEHQEKLDKTQIGECLGKEPEYGIVKGKEVDAEYGGAGVFVQVLYYYVDAMDFAGMQFDDAIRAFLSGFRLPGEAQKIDRIMEKFAERFTRQNEEIFPTADTAFILAFSVIMLNTDLHNPNIKPEKRMTLASFIRNNRGIAADGGDLPEDFLTGIFKGIQANPFTLKEDDQARAKVNNNTSFDASFLFDSPSFFGANAEDRKREEFRKEREEMMLASEQLFKKRPGKKGVDKAAAAASSELTDSVSPADVVKPMFDVTWGPLIGTLSQILETSSDEDSVALCLLGFVYAVRIASHSGMSLARDTFINSLAKLTTLGSIKEMKHKNIESIRTLLSIAIIDGEYLGESWGPVLQCISQLGRLQLFASGVDSDDKFLTKTDSKELQVHDGGGFFRQPSKADTEKAMEENNGRVVIAAVNEMLIDKVFSCSVNLSSRGIVHFIEQLIIVSAAEISGDSKRGITGVGSTRKLSDSAKKTGTTHGDGGPRIFSLQRLVEVADYNMDIRPRICWVQMWELMSNHFAHLGCHKNAMVSMFAIDALRQMSFKFLQKPELSDFHFQRLFLRPFLQIMENTGSREDVREMVLRCLDNMVRSVAHNLRSGWKILFSILTLSASDPSEKINTLGLAALQRLIDEREIDHLFPLIDNDSYVESSTRVDRDTQVELSASECRDRNAKADDFVGICRASLSFVQHKESAMPLAIGLSMRGLCHAACYADLIADRRVLPPVSGSQTSDSKAPGYTYKDLSDEDALEMVLWSPLLDGLAAGICSPGRSNSGGVGCLVQRGSVMAMRSILLRHGQLFSVPQWKVILEDIILPAIQMGAECDLSPVAKITSESPSISSLDFLSEALPLPPAPDDEGLLKFATLSQHAESGPNRPLGKAELLVETSFADLRHGGDGNLSRAHGLTKKNLEGKSMLEQPFPDSWIATTAPIALGMLSDIASEIVIDFGPEGRKNLWPVIMTQFNRWSIGYPIFKRDSNTHVDDSEIDCMVDSEHWAPCEALIRIGCKELNRFPENFLQAIPRLPEDWVCAWTETLCVDIAATLSKNVSMQTLIYEELVESRLVSLGANDQEERTKEPSGVRESEEVLEDVTIKSKISTPYGTGLLVNERLTQFQGVDGSSSLVSIDTIQLDHGATLYAPHRNEETPDPPKGNDEGLNQASPRKIITRQTYLELFIPALKARCVASHCLQQHIPDVMSLLSSLTGKEQLSALLASLEDSRRLSSKASLDEDLAFAFQEALFNEWGDGVEEVEAALNLPGGNLPSTSSRGSSKMFFLTQEAGANKAIIHVLSSLYLDLDSKTHRLVEWERQTFSEPLLFERMMDVSEKFLKSEQDDGEKIDPNVWRISSESGKKVALYCTSFASVMVSILNTMLMLSRVQFNRHKHVLFPALCSLITVQSDEIRHLVREVLAHQVSPLIGIQS